MSLHVIGWLNRMDGRTIDSFPLPTRHHPPTPTTPTPLISHIQIYAPVFDRNARFAVKRPVPPLGDLTSEIEDVYR